MSKMKDALSKVIADTSLDRVKAESIWVQFEGFFREADACAKKIDGLDITDVSQKGDMQLARTTRLKLKGIRVSAEKTKKELKADILKEGRFIDATYRLIADAIKPVEEDLLEKENFAKRKEEERLANLKARRTSELEQYDVETRYYNLAEMSDEEYSQLVETSRVAHEERLESARKAEAERLAREQAEADERAAIEAENARLRAEREAREREIERELAEERAKVEAAEAAARAEREAREREIERELAEERAKVEAAEAAARAEREAREKAEREAVAAELARQAEELRKANEEKKRIEREFLKKEAADRAEQERVENERLRLEKAGDKEKLLAYIHELRTIPVPDLSSDEARKIIVEMDNCILLFARNIERLNQ
jgi:hypothetical protein